MLFLYLFLLLFSLSESLNISSESACNEKMVFVLDSSSSVNNEELLGIPHTFRKFKTETIHIIENNDIIGENIGVIIFDTKPEIIVHFNSSLDKTNIIDTINRLKYHRNVKHTHLDLALEQIEEMFIKDNVNIIKFLFFTDTQIGHEFMQPDEDHYRNIKNRFNNHYWNNDFIERYIYYEGNNINQSVLDLFPRENQYHIGTPFISNCYKQKCVDKFCIKKPEQYHKICINDSNQFVMYNSQCHYLCSNKEYTFLNNILELDKCYMNATYNITHTHTTITTSFNTNTNTTTGSTTTMTTPTHISTTTQYNMTIDTTTGRNTTMTTPTHISTTTQYNMTIDTITTSLGQESKQNLEDNDSGNTIYNIILVIVIIIVIIILMLNFLKYRKNRLTKKNRVIVLSPEKPETYNNRLFNNTIYDNITY
jgi:hypothetical protein